MASKPGLARGRSARCSRALENATLTVGKTERSARFARKTLSTLIRRLPVDDNGSC